MKKVLLGTSAIALASSFAAPANAAEWELEWGGFMETYLAFASTDIDNLPAGVAEDFDGVDAKMDGEVEFAPSITLDNGIKIGASIQLEARADARGASAAFSDAGGTPDVIDESHLIISGSFGDVLIGDENSAGYKMHVWTPDVTFLNINSGTITAFIPFSGTPATNGLGIGTGGDVFRRTLGTTYIENEGNNDSGRLTYFTPRFAGFQLGVSYARDATRDSLRQQNTAGAAISDIFDVGANYINSFGDFDVAMSARWGIASDDRAPVPGTDIGKNPQIYAFSARFGFAGFQIGGSFAEQNKADTEDGTAWNAGISYTTGPWGFSFIAQEGENVDEEANAVIPGADEELLLLLGGVNYDLAKGVSTNFYVGYADLDEEFGDPGIAGGPFNGGNDVEGFVIGTGLRISF